MNIDQVYRFLQYLSNKSQSGYLTPKDFNLSLPRALNEWVMKRYKNVNANSASELGWQKNQKITDDLRFLLERNKVVSVDATGEMVLPADYLHLDTINYKYSWIDDQGLTQFELRPVDIVRNSEIADFLSSKIYKRKIQKKQYAIAALYSDYVQIYPEDIQRVELTYLRKPKDPVWAFTVVNRKPVYDPINSVDLEAPDEAVNEIVMMCASYLGMNLREADLVQYSETLKDQGV